MGDYQQPGPIIGSYNGSAIASSHIVHDSYKTTYNYYIYSGKFPIR